VFNRDMEGSVNINRVCRTSIYIYLCVCVCVFVCLFVFMWISIV